MAAAVRSATPRSTSTWRRRAVSSAPIARACSSTAPSPRRTARREEPPMDEFAAPVVGERPADAPPPSAAPSAAPHHAFLIYGSGFIFRAYHALPPLSPSGGPPPAAGLPFSHNL